MTLKKVARSLGAALLYFGIYIAWQFVVTYWAMFGVMMVASIDIGTDMAAQVMADNAQYSHEDILDVSMALEEDIIVSASEWILDHAMHLTVISGVLTLITYAVMFKMRKKNPLSEVGLTRIPVVSCFGMLLLGAELNVGISFILPLIPFPDTWWSDYAVQTEAIFASKPWLTVLMTVIVAPFLEEVVFRGLVYTRIKRCMPMFAAMIISAWLFGLMHGSVIAFAYASILGFVLAWVFEKCGSLTAPILLHVGFNLCALFIGELSYIPVLVCVAAVLVSAVIIAYVQFGSKNKIEFVLPKSEDKTAD